LKLTRFHLWLLVLALWLVAAPAWAEKVFVLRPDRTDVVLTEAFNRLQAELWLANFEVEVRGDESGSDAVELRTAAVERGAFAAVAFARSDDTTSVDVWVDDRATGSTATRTLELADVEDAPRVLALRAVDFVRSALRDAEGREREPTSSPTERVEAERPSPHAVEEERRERAVELRLGAEALFTGSPGIGYGPLLGAAYRYRELQIGLAFTGPALGTEWRAEEGIVTFHQELLLAEARFELVRLPPFSLGPTLAVGGYLLPARGEAKPPLVSRSDTEWAFAVAPGIGVRHFLCGDLFLDLSGRALLLLPRPGVSLEEDRTLLLRPLFTAAAGAGVEL
jgi:hypothetical protein